MASRLLFLGTGGSMGIPIIGCDCAVCNSDSPHNKRLRPSALLTIGLQKFVIDTGPDFRAQALCHSINHIDGVIFTHAHNDHTAGVDELRIYNVRTKEPMPCLMSKETLDDLKARFYYIFTDAPSKYSLISHFNVQILEGERGTVQFQNQKIQYVTYEQAGMKVNGYRIGNLAYISDIRNYPETIFEDLKGVDHLIMSALRFTPSPIHFTVDEAVDFAQRVGAKHTWLTHISHELDHEKTNAYLPPEVRLAYDGLEISFDEEKNER